ncbi:MAG: hypothetical protein IT158_13170, partial [Bryobacterales bacterium]|nr:hypothetical protein [Bryobacterales bacterium]
MPTLAKRGRAWMAALLLGAGTAAAATFRGGRLSPRAAYPFISRDGSGPTFIPDVNSPNFDYLVDEVDVETFSETSHLVSGKLMFPNGVQYVVDNGLVQSIRDRNGNRIAFQYAYVTIDGQQSPTPYVTRISDPLGREISVEYDQEDARCGRCDRIAFQGAGGASRVILVKKAAIQDRLRSDYNPATPLFPRISTAPIASFPALRKFPSEVILPNGRKYSFYYNNYGEVARVELPSGGA